MNEKTAVTTQKWQGEYKPEVGNLASVGNLSKPGADYGIVTEVHGNNVTVAWYVKRHKRQRARPENKGHQAARRVVAQDTMDATNDAYAEVQR